MCNVHNTHNSVYMHLRQRVIDSQYAIVDESGNHACVCKVINETERFCTKPRSLLLLILAGLCLVNAIPQG